MKAVLRIAQMIVLLSVCAAASAHASPFSIAAGQLGAAYNPGTIPIGTPAVSVTNAPYTFFSNNTTIGYTYNTDGSTNATAGFLPDYHFLGSAGTTPATAPIWTFSALEIEYYLYSTIDHTPLPYEALESSLWGSGDGGSTWIKGTVAEVYEQGGDPLGIPDDGSTRWLFSSPVNMIAAEVGLTQGMVGQPPYSYGDGDFEIDAVMQRSEVPEPGTSILLLSGLGLLVARRTLRTRGSDAR